MLAAPGPHVVVGVTDSAGSRWALAAAVGLARQSGLPLKVVAAIPSATRGRYDLVTDQDHYVAAHELVGALFADVCGGMPTGVRIERQVVRETPGRALVAAAGPADVLVIGSSGGLNGLTRRYCARRTPCALVVVPRPDVSALLGTPITAARSPEVR